MRALHVLCLLTLSACATTTSPRSPVVATDDAAKLVARLVDLGNARDPRVAELYADEAHVRIVAWSPDGRVRRLVMDGKQLKSKYLQLLAAADPRDKSSYECTYQPMQAKEGWAANKVFVRCMRHSLAQDYWAAAQFVVGKNGEGEMRVFVDVTWTCTSPRACTRDLPWARMACAEGKNWRVIEEQLEIDICSQRSDNDAG